MHLLHTVLNEAQKQSVMELWNAEYPAQLAYTHTGELDEYLSKLQNTMHYLYTDGEGHLKAWGMVFTRENERWFAMIVHRLEQNKGLGSSLLKTLKENESELNGWSVTYDIYKKSDDSLYVPTLPFYLKHGFTATGKKLETEKLKAVQVRWQRTAQAL